jgi:hypothetical protein
MPYEEREKHGGVSRPAGTNGRIQVRPKNWLVPVTLLTLRECTSYGYRLMEQTAAFGFGTMNLGTSYRTLRHMWRTACASTSGTRKAVRDRHGGCTRSRTLGRCTLGSGPRLWSSSGATSTPSSVWARVCSQGETGTKTMGRGSKHLEAEKPVGGAILPVGSYLARCR